MMIEQSAKPDMLPFKPRIALGVSGGIAAYKAVEILRGLQRAGCEVRVGMTKRACEFVAPLTFRALSGEHVLVDDYAPDNPDPIAHITFSQTIDLFLIAPATANIIAKLANGIADDFLTSTYLASTAPVIIAPAMNTQMWNHPATQRNIARLRRDGVHIIEPDEGGMACKTTGSGRLSEPECIVRTAMEILREQNSEKRFGSAQDSFTTQMKAKAQGSTDEEMSSLPKDLTGERILITAGATREKIDPVRFLSNRSSGRMGFALAEIARIRGAESVTVVTGATSAPLPDGVQIVRGESAEEMWRAVMKEVEAATVFIAAAAVSDYRPVEVAEHKIKKSDTGRTIVLEPTTDILAEVARARSDGLLVIGFAAETENLIENARDKLIRKNLDLVIANDVTREGAGFDAETNIVTLIARDRRAPIEIPLMTKREAAHLIWNEIVRLRREMNYSHASANAGEAQ
jgi:phosphopantothenoylcysteine decarboxylase / phosphopantothenate---cysteine ligase